MLQRTCNIVPNVRLSNNGRSVYSFQTTLLPPQTYRPIHVILFKTEDIKQNKWVINVSYINPMKHRGIRITFGLPFRGKTEYGCSGIHWACILVLTTHQTGETKEGYTVKQPACGNKEDIEKTLLVLFLIFGNGSWKSRHRAGFFRRTSKKKKVEMSLSTARSHRGEYRYSSTQFLSRH
jgi:hypothetical protein